MGVNMDSNILSALISAGVSFMITGLYWGGKQVYEAFRKRKSFKTYKAYAQECLKQLIYYYEKHKIVHWDDKDKYYKWEDLEWYFIKETGNETIPQDDNSILNIILSFIGERDLLTKEEQVTILKILLKMSTENWIFHAKLVGKDGIKQEFSDIFISDSSKKIITGIYYDHYCVIFDHCANKDFCENLLLKLEKGDFDTRIKKIIEIETQG
ncbi:MAG: hypothetical protein ACRC9L_00845 [Brevinema sp.]